jgi:hypothetical protein
MMALLVEIQVVFLHLDNEMDKLFNFFMISMDIFLDIICKE